MYSLINYTPDLVLQHQFIWSFFCVPIFSLANPWILYLYVRHQSQSIKKFCFLIKFSQSKGCNSSFLYSVDALPTQILKKVPSHPRFLQCEVQVTEESSPWHSKHLHPTSAENLNKEIFKSLWEMDTGNLYSDKKGTGTLLSNPYHS